MIMGEKPKPQMNPFSKVTTLRGFNNTPDNIRKQRENAHRAAISKNNPQQTPQHPPANRSNYDSSKQRETGININLLNKR